MPSCIRIIKLKAVPKTGSFEVRFADGRRPISMIFRDGACGQRLSPAKQTLEQAKALARAERDKAG